MPILVKDVVEKIKKKIAALPEESQFIKPLVRLESYFSSYHLFNLFDQVVGSNELAGTETLEFLLAFLSDRWDDIEGTDAIYLHNPRSFINQCCLILAEELSEFFHEHHYFLMMPNLRSIRNEAIKRRLIDLKLNFNGFFYQNRSTDFFLKRIT